MMLPSLVVIASIILYPLVRSLGLGFFRYSLLDPDAGLQFRGFANFAYFFSQEVFWRSFSNGTILTLAAVAVQIAIAMILALLLNMRIRMRGVLRGLVILPWATPTFVAAFAWRWLLDAQYGLINIALTRIGLLEEGVPWLGLPQTALIWVIVAHVWKGVPWVTVVLLSALQMVPKELEEAARVDGASSWRVFWNVTIPSIKNVLVVVILLRSIWTFNWFDYVYLLTGGGPLDATMTWPILVYKTGFEAYRFGRASSLAGVMFIVLVTLTLQYFRLLGKDGDL